MFLGKQPVNCVVVQPFHSTADKLVPQTCRTTSKICSLVKSGSDASESESQITVGKPWMELGLQNIYF